MSLTIAAVVLACAMCANPDGAATAPPPVIAIHDVDQARATENCATVGAIVATSVAAPRCVILPPPLGIDPGPAVVIVTLYTDNTGQAEADRVALNDAWHGHAVTRVKRAADAPPCPCVGSPQGDGKFHAVAA